MLRSDSHFGMLGIRSSLYEHKTCHPGTTRTLLSCSCSVTPNPHTATMPTAPYLFDVICCGLVWEGFYDLAQTILGLMRQPRLCLMSQWSCFSFLSAEIIDVSYHAWSFCPIWMGRQEQGLERNTVGSHTKVHLDTELWGQGRLFLCHL